MSYRIVWNYCMIHVSPTCASWQGDRILSHTGNNLLHAHVTHEPPQRTGAKCSFNHGCSSTSATSARRFNQARNKLSAWSSRCQWNAMWSSWPGAGNIWEYPQNSKHCQSTVCYWHSMRRLYSQCSTEISSCSTSRISLYLIEFHLKVPAECWKKSFKMAAGFYFNHLTQY